MAKKKRTGRTWHGVVEPAPDIPFRKWAVVMAELKPGTVSVGIRFDEDPTAHFFMLHKTPAEATKVVADIAKGTITLKDIAGYDWQAVELPFDQMGLKY